MNPKILIIIPALNEGGSIGKLIHEIRAVEPPADILVVNDGSTDSTEEEAQKAGAWVASLPFNLGIGGAVQTGYQIAQALDYDIAIQVDGDGQHIPTYLKELIQPVRDGNLDLCIGSRFLDKQSDAYRSTFVRRLGIRFFSRLLGFLTGFYATDPTSGFRAAGKKLIRIFSDYYPIDFPEPEAIKIAKRHGARVGEIPVRMRQRQEGHSSIRYFATFYYMIKVSLAILIDSLKEKN